MSFVKKNQTWKKETRKSHKSHVNKLVFILFHKRTIALHGQKPMENYHSNTKQSAWTIIIH